MKKTLVAATLLAASLYANAELTLSPYHPGHEAIFDVTSTLITGEKDAILVDAQFQKQYAKAVVDQIKKSGKNLKYIYISHSDPDYYFGLDEITAAFPNAKVVSSAQTAYLINASKDGKMAVWGEQLKADAPKFIVVPQALAGDKLELDGEAIEIKLDPKDSAHSYLWIPSSKTVLGGISVTPGEHLWMADTQSQAELTAWIKQIDSMKALQPTAVIPSHGFSGDTSAAQLDWVKNYLQAYQKASADDADAAKIVAEMVRQYPDLAGKEGLEMGAAVFTGKMQWHTASPYPLIGRTAIFDYGTHKFEVHAIDNNVLHIKTKNGTNIVDYHTTEVAKNVFMVTWHEPKSGNNVVLVQDFNHNVVYANLFPKAGEALHWQGTILLK